MHKMEELKKAVAAAHVAEAARVRRERKTGREENLPGEVEIRERVKNIFTGAKFTDSF